MSEKPIFMKGVSTAHEEGLAVTVFAQHLEAGGKITYHTNRIFHVVFKRDEEGWIVAQCEEIPEAISQGRDEEEAMRNVKEAIACILEDDYGGEVPESEIRVEVRWEE